MAGSKAWQHRGYDVPTFCNSTVSSLLHDAFESAGIPEDGAQRALAIVLAILGRADVLDELAEGVNATIDSATRAALERDDLYDSPADSRVMAIVATRAVLTGLGIEPPGGFDPLTPGQMAERLQRVHYKDWSFDLRRLPDGQMAVRVVARLADRRREGAEFITSRLAPVITSVEEAALRAVLQVETHEAREVFEAGGRALFSAHDPSQFPEPASRRRSPPGERDAART